MSVSRQSVRQDRAGESDRPRPSVWLRGSFRAAAVLCLFLCWLGTSLPAQDAPQPSLPKSAESTPIETPPADVVYLEGPDGKPVPLPRGAQMDKFLKFIEEERNPRDETPAPSVARLEMTGHANDEWAVLTATLVIHNPQAKGYVPIALGLHEAVLRDWKHRGPGEMSQRTVDRSQGQVWWVHGQGEHVLTLEFSAPVKKQMPNRRLQLTLPEATVSRLQLVTEFREIKLTKEIEGSQVQIVANAGQPARIEVFGLGTRLDLNWQPVIIEPSNAPQVEADTAILVQADGDKLRLDASQRLHVLQGSLSEAIVHLPANAELVNVDGRDYRDHRVDPEDPSKVTVQLASADGNHFQLTWTVLLPADESRKFVLEGFQVDQARRQRGLIGLVQTEGLRMRVLQANQPHVRQIDAGQLRHISSSVSQAYQFSSQPFRVVVEVKGEEPYFTVEPRLSLSVSTQELNLEGTFAVHVFRGNLTALNLVWPNWKSDEWILQSVEPLKSLDSDSQGQSGYLRLQLQDGHPDQFSIHLKARRPLRPGETIAFSLPQITVPDPIRTVLEIADAANVSSDVVALGETRLESQTESAESPAPEAGTRESRLSRVYQLLPGEQSLSLRADRQEQRVELITETRLERSGNQLAAVQRFLFDVQHERMSQVQILIPEIWRQRSLNLQVDGEPARAEWLPSDNGGAARVRVVFPEPRLGRFSVDVSFEIPLPDEALSGAATINVPIFSCVGHTASQSEVQVDPAEWLEMTVADADWIVRPDLTGMRRWATDEAVASVNVNLNPGGGGAKQFLISQASVLAEWDRSGGVHCRAAFRISGWFAKINVILPPECQAARYQWDGVPVSEDRDVEQAGGGGLRHLTIRVPAPRAEDEVHELVINYDLAAKQPFGVYNGWTIAAPQLPQGLWLSHRLWRLSFPMDQHLFSYPATVSPLFAWQRTGLFWSRVTDARYLSDFPGGESIPTIDDRKFDQDEAAHVYAFRMSGDVREWRVSTMSRSLVLLIGASVALAAGFFLLNVSWARNLLTLWVAAFLIALVGLRYQPQLELLLQAVVIGLLFPLLAVGIQLVRRRQRPIAVLSYDPLLDASESRSSFSGAMLRSSEPGVEPTVLRAPSGSTRDFQRAEAGSGFS